MSKIYIAIPYSSVDKEQSFKTSNRIAAELYKQGHIVYAPISHSHPIAIQEGLAGGFKFWQKIDFEFIRWCDYMIVVSLAGWDKSRGVKMEMDYCRSIGKEIIIRDIKK